MNWKRMSQPSPAAPTQINAILFRVGPYRMAIAASALQAIRKDRGLAPAEFGCTAIVSAHEMFGIPSGEGSCLLVLHPGQVAVRVDTIERMFATASLERLPRAFQGAERDWYSGLALSDGMVIPVLKPETLKQEANRREEETFDALWAQFKPLEEAISS